jgi:hypothetical protein
VFQKPDLFPSSGEGRGNDTYSIGYLEVRPDGGGGLVSKMLCFLIFRILNGEQNPKTQ